MNNTASTIKTGDQIFATLILGGKIIASVCKSNFASIDEVVRFITGTAGRFMGLAQLSIRNKTQGWSTSMSLATRQAQQPARRLPQRQGTYRQASLFA